MLIFLDKSYYSYTPSVKLAVCALFSCQRAKHVCRLLYIPLRLPPSQSDSCAITCLVIIWLCFFESLASLASWTCTMPKSERWQIVLPPSRYYGELEKVNTRQVFAMIFQCFFKAQTGALWAGFFERQKFIAATKWVGFVFDNLAPNPSGLCNDFSMFFQSTDGCPLGGVFWETKVYRRHKMGRICIW